MREVFGPILGFKVLEGPRDSAGRISMYSCKTGLETQILHGLRVEKVIVPWEEVSAFAENNALVITVQGERRHVVEAKHAARYVATLSDAKEKYLADTSPTSEAVKPQDQTMINADARVMSRVMRVWAVAVIGIALLFLYTRPPAKAPPVATPPPAQSTPVPPVISAPQHAMVLEQTPARNSKDLARIIEEIVQATAPGIVQSVGVMTFEEQGGLVVGAEVALSDANSAWLIARNAVLGAYLNKGDVRLARIGIGITAPEHRSYALQVFVGRERITAEVLNGLKVGTTEDFAAWMRTNNQSQDEFLRGDSPTDDLRAQGALAVDREIEQARRRKIEAQFSTWDGTHAALTEAVRRVMHNPRSFRHVETVYWDMQDHLVVRMTFRGTNQFGAIVTQVVRAWVSLDGVLQRWEWEQ